MTSMFVQLTHDAPLVELLLFLAGGLRQDYTEQPIDLNQGLFGEGLLRGLGTTMVPCFLVAIDIFYLAIQYKSSILIEKVFNSKLRWLKGIYVGEKFR